MISNLQVRANPDCAKHYSKIAQTYRGKKRRTQCHNITGGILVPELLLILIILFQTLRSEVILRCCYNVFRHSC